MILTKVYEVIMSYNKESQLFFDDHLAIILQVPLVDESLIMNAYTVYNLPIPHPVFQKKIHYSVEGDCLELLSDADFTTLTSECNMLIYVFTRGHMCWFDTTCYPTEKIPSIITLYF